MLRITRIVAKDKIFDLLNKEYIVKIELKQGKQKFKNPVICRAEIYLALNDNSYFKSILSNIKSWAINNNCNIARTTVDTALRDGFIKESAFNNFSYPMPRKYKDLCNLYSQDKINKFNLGL